MGSNHIPVVGSRYTNTHGESLEIIGRGTGGLVVEYIDGRVELVDLETWWQQSLEPAAQEGFASI